jgi:hypothetical protein
MSGFLSTLLNYRSELPRTRTGFQGLGDALVASVPVTTQNIQTLIAQFANQSGVGPALALAVAKLESNFDPNATGSNGDAGIFQLLPGTAADLGVTDPYDPVQNIQAGVLYLAQLLQKYSGDVTTALEAYNGGQGNVDRGTIPSAAQAYPGLVMANIPFAQSILASLGFSAPSAPAGSSFSVATDNSTPSSYSIATDNSTTDAGIDLSGGSSGLAWLALGVAVFAVWWVTR